MAHRFIDGPYLLIAWGFSMANCECHNQMVDGLREKKTLRKFMKDPKISPEVASGISIHPTI
jgi:hypothetical protein